MNIKTLSVTAILLIAFCSCSYAAESQSAETQHILNVVIIELDTSPDAKLTEPVVNDWEYWDKCAGKLITRLESELGYKRAMKTENSNASLFAIRATSKGLDDPEGLMPLTDELSRICKTTMRPSFLILWLPQTGEVYLVVHDNHELNAAVAFTMLSKLRSGSQHFLICGGALSYSVPPCLLWNQGWNSSLRSSGKVSLDDIFNNDLINNKLLHVILGATVQVIVDTGIKTLADSSPIGAAMEHLTPTWSRFTDTMGDLMIDPIDISIAPGGIGPTIDMQPYRMHFREFLGNTWRPALMDFKSGQLGGILLEPELLIVVDQNGIISAMEEKAVAAVKGKTGGTFEHEGTQYTAVKTPRTAGMFQVPAGYFHLIHTDITAASGVNITPRLARCYDSANKEVSALGPGWSILPFLLKFDQRVEAKDGKNMVALKLVLIDRQAGAKLPYCLMKADSPMSQSDEEAVVAMYQKVSSSLQPDLVAHSDGGYRATFAHGFEVAFDKDGRIKWMGNSEVDRVEYVFNGDQLKEIRSNTSKKITLLYNEKGQLTSAKSTSGHLVTYTLDSSGRLKSVTGSDSGSFEFAYGSDGRLSTISANGGKQKPDMLIANTYDDKGRMLIQRTPQGQWEFAYNDDIGRVITTDPMDRQTTYFYDAHQRLVAYGTFKDQMTLFNYDMTGRILQVAVAKMLNNPSKTERPKFKISEKVFPSPSRKEEKTEG